MLYCTVDSYIISVERQYTTVLVVHNQLASTLLLIHN